MISDHILPSIQSGAGLGRLILDIVLPEILNVEEGMKGRMMEEEGLEGEEAMQEGGKDGGERMKKGRMKKGRKGQIGTYCINRNQ